MNYGDLICTFVPILPFTVQNIYYGFIIIKIFMNHRLTPPQSLFLSFPLPSWGSLFSLCVRVSGRGFGLRTEGLEIVWGVEGSRRHKSGHFPW